MFTVLFFRVDFAVASETFLIDYFFVSLAFRKCCDFFLKVCEIMLFRKERGKEIYLAEIKFRLPTFITSPLSKKKEKSLYIYLSFNYFSPFIKHLASSNSMGNVETAPPPLFRFSVLYPYIDLIHICTNQF